MTQNTNGTEKHRVNGTSPNTAQSGAHISELFKDEAVVKDIFGSRGKVQFQAQVPPDPDPAPNPAKQKPGLESAILPMKTFLFLYIIWTGFIICAAAMKLLGLAIVGAVVAVLLLVYHVTICSIIALRKSRESERGS